MRQQGMLFLPVTVVQWCFVCHTKYHLSGVRSCFCYQ